MEQNLIKIFNKFGETDQIMQLIDEERELYEAVNAMCLTLDKEHIEAVVEEVIDCLVIASQLYIVNCGGNIEQIKAIFNHKVNRTLSIIEEMDKTNKSYDEVRRK